MIKILKKINKLLLLVCAFVIMNSLQSFAADIIDVNIPLPYNVNLAVDGTITWDIDHYQSGIIGQYYDYKSFQLRLIKATVVLEGTNVTYVDKETGSARTVAGSEREYQMNIGSSGYYKVKVRAVDLTGAYSEWTTSPYYTTVTAEDTNQGSTTSSGNTSGGPGVSNNTNTTNNTSNVIGPHTNTSNTQKSGWNTDANGKYYMQSDGTYPKNSWAYIDGKYYRFNSSGYMKTGWFKDPTNNSWYYLDGNGIMVTGPYYIDGYFYYFNDLNGVGYGVMAENKEVVINGQYYAYDSNGRLIFNQMFNNHFYGPAGSRIY
ncbi:MAG: hypothetical protein Q4F88_02560 [Eubacteriales bacterium]|nr:hypothetical protein [Eubacteriales bacterium]